MLTDRDREIVGWLARIGAAGAGHVRLRLGLGHTQAYSRLAALSADGLIAHHMVLHARPGVYVATREGLRWLRLERLGVFRVSPALFEHAFEVAGVAALLETTLPAWRMLTERELRVLERDRGQPLASIRTTDSVRDRPLWHRPDLVLLGPTGRTVAVEVELSVKARRRLLAICRGYARARHVDRVFYLAAPSAERAVANAVRDTRAEARIVVLPLDAVDRLVAELGGGGGAV